MFTTKNLFTLFGKHILIASVVVILSGGAVLLISGKITEISTETARNRHLATALGERTALLSNLKHETEIIGSNDMVIKNAFIPSNNILEFVSVLKNLAIRNGLTQAFNFSSPTPGAPEAPFPLATITYQNTISSSNVSMFINYLKEFEQLPYFTKIESLNISSGAGDWSNPSTISFSATVAAQTMK